MRVQLLSYVQLFETPWTVARQAPLSMEFSRQEYQSGLPFPSPGSSLTQGLNPGAPELSGEFLTTEQLGRSSIKGTWLDFFFFKWSGKDVFWRLDGEYERGIKVDFKIFGLYH